MSMSPPAPATHRRHPSPTPFAAAVIDLSLVCAGSAEKSRVEVL